MKKSISHVFKNCTVDGGILVEYEKDMIYEHDIMEIFKRLDGEEGLNITIKKESQYGAIRKTKSASESDSDFENYDTDSDEEEV